MDEEEQVKKKKRKYLDKKCPECEEKQLFLVSRIVIKSGVEYTIKYIECECCDFSEKFKPNKKHEIEKRILDGEYLPSKRNKCKDFKRKAYSY